MSSLSKIILPAAALILLSATAASAGSLGNGAFQRVSSVPGAGVSYPAAPTMVTPTAATPGQEVPYSTQTPSTSQSSSSTNNSSNNNQSSDGSSQSTGSGTSGTKSGQTAAVAPTTPVTPPAPMFDKTGHPYSHSYFPARLSYLTMAMLRRSDLKPDQFILHLTSRNPVTGCFKISKIPSTVDFKESSMEITLDDFTADLRHASRSPEYGCHLRPQMPTADIILSANDLLQKNIKQIKLKIGKSAMTDSFDVDITQQRIRLAPSSTQRSGLRFYPPRLSKLSTPLTHWFYPQGTVLLYVPGAHDRDVADALDTMAKTQGLVPIENEFPEFKSPLKDSTYFYFIDKKGLLLKNQDINGGMIAGTIPLPKTVYGLEKDEQVTENVQVLARLPDSYE